MSVVSPKASKKIALWFYTSKVKLKKQKGKKIVLMISFSNFCPPSEIDFQG